MKTNFRKGVKMDNRRMALVAAIALCAFFCLTGCSEPGGHYNPDWSAGMDLSEACAIDTDADAGIEPPSFCTDGIDMTLTLSRVTGTNEAGQDVTESTVLTATGSGTEWVFAIDEIDADDYDWAFANVPEHCAPKMADGTDIPNPIEVFDKEADAAENQRSFKLVCDFPPVNDTDDPPDVIVNVDGGMDPEDLCPWLTPTIKATAFDGSQPVDSDTTPLAGVTFTLSGPIEQLELIAETLGDAFSPTCTTTTENPTCEWDCLIPNSYYSVTVTADGYDGVIWDNSGINLEAGQTYDLQFPLSPSTDHPENSVVEFPGFNMAEGTSMSAADMYFGRYDADETAVPIPASEATYAVLSGTSVTLDGGASDAGPDPLSGDVAVLTATEVGQTHIQRCWLGVEPNPCQTFVVTVY